MLTGYSGKKSNVKEFPSIISLFLNHFKAKKREVSSIGNLNLSRNTVSMDKTCENGRAFCFCLGKIQKKEKVL